MPVPLHHGPPRTPQRERVLVDAAGVQDLVRIGDEIADAQRRASELYQHLHPEAPRGEWERLPARIQAHYLQEVQQPCLGRLKTAYMRQVRQPGDRQAAVWLRAGLVCKRCRYFWPEFEPE